MKENYFRTSRKTIQKIMEITGENPMSCISQQGIRELDEIYAMKKVLEALGQTSQHIDLRRCKNDPPDCRTIDGAGNMVGWEVTELCDAEVENFNANAAPREWVYRDWTPADLEVGVRERILEKNRKIEVAKRKTPPWPYFYVNVVVVTDEIAITKFMAEKLVMKFSTLEADHIQQAYLLLSYLGESEGCPCIQVR
jgi:hypothetical protein